MSDSIIDSATRLLHNLGNIQKLLRTEAEDYSRADYIQFVNIITSCDTSIFIIMKFIEEKDWKSVCYCFMKSKILKLEDLGKCFKTKERRNEALLLYSHVCNELAQILISMT